MRTPADLLSIYAVGGWDDWSPTYVWGTADPASITTVARYISDGSTVSFLINIQSADGNSASSLTISLPKTPAHKHIRPSFYVRQIVDSNFYPVSAYITDDGADNLIHFDNFAVCTNAKAFEISIQGFYEME